MGASFDGGEFITTEWEIDGGQLVLNAKNDYDEIRVELLDDEEKPLPGYSLEDCVPVTADGTDLPVQWKDHSDLSGAPWPRPERGKFEPECRLVVRSRPVL